jgi:hypothetical protein
VDTCSPAARTRSTYTVAVVFSGIAVVARARAARADARGLPRLGLPVAPAIRAASPAIVHNALWADLVVPMPSRAVGPAASRSPRHGLGVPLYFFFSAAVA